jgi:cytochrome P450
LPQRWETINPSPYEYIAFSAGPRMCVGATFAMMEMKIILAILLQRYRLSLAPGAKVNYRVLPILSTPTLPMTIHPQDRQFRPSPARGTIRELVELE